jgi:hypothetical protein
MAAQLQRLLAVTELPNVTLQVLPFEAGAHPALDSTFILLDLPAPSPGAVYVEGLAGQLYLERPQDVERYAAVFAHLVSASLDQAGSLELIAKQHARFQF